jgi:hypothetical protein
MIFHSNCHSNGYRGKPELRTAIPLFMHVPKLIAFIVVMNSLCGEERGGYGTRAGKLNGKPLGCQEETLRCYFACNLSYKDYRILTVNCVKSNSTCIFPDTLSPISNIILRHYRKQGWWCDFRRSHVDSNEQDGIVATLWGSLIRISTGK